MRVPVYGERSDAPYESGHSSVPSSSRGTGNAIDGRFGVTLS